MHFAIAGEERRDAEPDLARAAGHKAHFQAGYDRRCSSYMVRIAPAAAHDLDGAKDSRENGIVIRRLAVIADGLTLILLGAGPISAQSRRSQVDCRFELVRARRGLTHLVHESF